MASDGAIEAVASAKRHALDAATAGEALDAAMGALHGPFSLWFGVIATYIAPGEAKVVASWSPVSTPLEPGLVVHAASTPELLRLHQQVMSGRTVVFDPAELDAGLLGDLLDTGTRTTVVGVPIVDREGTQGVMGFVSAAEEGIDEEGTRLLEALVAGLSPLLAPWCRHAVRETS